MPSYEPPKRATEYVTYVSLIDQASGKLFKANPTLAAGDVKVSIDGGALANLTTLPTVTPAAGKLVKVTVSAAEMTGDNIKVLFSDAAGAEWNDLLVTLHPTLRQVDDLATSTALATVQTDTDDIQARLPAALVGGRIDASTGAMAASVLTAAAIAADAITAAKIAPDAIGASELAADAVAEIADQVWDEVLSGHLTAGTTGAALNGAGSAGDPWGTALPGAYGAGSAGKIVGDNINATISSRATPAQVNTEADLALADVGMTTTVTGRIDAAVTTRLAPTVAGRTLDVATTGEAGLDFDNVKAATGATTLTNITVPVVTAVTNDVGITQAGADKTWLTAARTLTAFGFSVAISAGAVQAIWDAATTALTTAGSIGKRIADFLTGDSFTRLGAPVGASHSADRVAVKADTAAIKLKTDTLPASPANEVTVAAVKAKTDNLPVDPADESNTQARFNTIDATLVILDDFLDTEIAAIKAKTDNLPALPAAVSNIPTATENADALLNRNLASVTVTNSRSPINALRFLRNKWSLTAIPGSLVIYQEDDTTIAWQGPVTTDNLADPVTSVDPT